MLRRLAAPFVFALVLAPGAFGQVIYENVRYQHVTDSGQTYYYGGQSPSALFWAELRSALDAGCYDRYRYGAFSGGDRCGDGLFNAQPRVYSDFAPFRNAARYGFTADDARNQAVRSAPLYFRKLDLLRAGELQYDGSIIVPSHPSMVVVVDRNASRADRDANTTKPAATGRILIIPKPKPAASDKQQVASR